MVARSRKPATGYRQLLADIFRRCTDRCRKLAVTAAKRCHRACFGKDAILKDIGKQTANNSAGRIAKLQSRDDRDG